MVTDPWIFNEMIDLKQRLAYRLNHLETLLVFELSPPHNYRWPPDKPIEEYLAWTTEDRILD